MQREQRVQRRLLLVDHQGRVGFWFGLRLRGPGGVDGGSIERAFERGWREGRAQEGRRVDGAVRGRCVAAGVLVDDFFSAMQRSAIGFVHRHH